MPCHTPPTASSAVLKAVPMASPAAEALSEQSVPKSERAFAPCPMRSAKKSVTASHALAMSSESAKKPSAMPRPQPVKKSAISSARACAPEHTSSQFLYSIHAARATSPSARTSGFAQTEAVKAVHAILIPLMMPVTTLKAVKAVRSTPRAFASDRPVSFSHVIIFASAAVSPLTKPIAFHSESRLLLPPLR